MLEKSLNDYIRELFQDFCEIESIIKILKDSVLNENTETTMQDIGNTLEVIFSKTTNTKIALKKYIDTAF